MAGYTKELSRQNVLYSDNTLVTSGASVNSGFRRLAKSTFTITKKHTTGTYTLTLDWSMDGTNTAFTTTPTLTDNTPLAVTAIAPYVKITIAATVSNFTVHQTTVVF